MQMNLLTESFRIRMALRAQLRRWAFVWTVCVIGSVAVCATEAYRTWNFRIQLAEARQRAQSTQTLVERSEELKAELAQAGKRTDLLRNLQPPDHSLPLISMLTASAKHSERNIHIHRFAMQSDRIPPQVRKAKASANETGDAAQREVATVVTIHGTATSDRAVSQLVDHLRSYDLFRKVDLKSTSVLAGAGDEGREFHVECHY